MRYSQFGKTGMNVSQLCIGTWAIGGARWGKVDHDESVAAIKTMLEQGVNFIDTAPAYNAGAAERVVGESVKGMRDKVYITTKIGVRYINDNYVNSNDPQMVFQQCEQSLKDLDTDYIDLYLIHWPSEETPVGKTLEAINKLKEQGKVRHIGVSNFSPEQMEEAMQYADIEALQPPFSMINRTSLRNIKWAHDHDMGTMTYGSLAGGILTGAMRTVPDLHYSDTRRTFYHVYQEPEFSEVMKVLKILDEIAAAHGNVPLAQLVINWQSQKEYVSSCIVGVRNPKEALENCSGMDWMLTDDEVKRIDDALETYLSDEFMANARKHAMEKVADDFEKETGEEHPMRKRMREEGKK